MQRLVAIARHVDREAAGPAPPPPRAAPAANAPGAYRVMPVELHDRIVSAAFEARGFSAEEAADAAHVARLASWHGVHSHAGIKALHLDHHLGSAHGGCASGGPRGAVAWARWRGCCSWAGASPPVSNPNPNP